MCTLSTALFAAPEQLWPVLLKEAHCRPEAYYVGRRAGCIFLGLAILPYSMRNMPPSSPFRKGYCQAVATVFITLAVLGVWELWFGDMAPLSILLPVATEVVFGIGFLYHAYVPGSSNQESKKCQ